MRWVYFFHSGSPMSCNVGRTTVNPGLLKWPGVATGQCYDVNVPSTTLKKAHLDLCIYNVAFTHYTHRHELWISVGYLVLFPGLPSISLPQTALIVCWVCHCFHSTWRTSITASDSRRKAGELFRMQSDTVIQRRTTRNVRNISLG